ncbi:hypothetical protein DRQ29_05510, partial [bacterium]
MGMLGAMANGSTGGSNNLIDALKAKGTSMAGSGGDAFSSGSSMGGIGGLMSSFAVSKANNNGSTGNKTSGSNTNTFSSDNSEIINPFSTTGSTGGLGLSNPTGISSLKNTSDMNQEA